MKRAASMMRAVNKEDGERGREYRESIDKEKVVFPDGSRREIYGHLLDGTRKKMKTMRGVGRPEYFSMQAPDYEKGPDGLYFHWDGGWEPTNLWRNGSLSPQRDPDGNVWVETDGEWRLMDEVA